MSVIEEPDWPTASAGPVLIRCPTCLDVIKVPVTAQLVGEAQPHLVLEPDMTDLWAHAWTHGDPEVDDA